MLVAKSIDSRYRLVVKRDGSIGEYLVVTMVTSSGYTYTTMQGV